MTSNLAFQATGFLLGLALTWTASRLLEGSGPFGREGVKPTGLSEAPVRAEEVQQVPVDLLRTEVDSGDEVSATLAPGDSIERRRLVDLITLAETLDGHIDTLEQRLLECQRGLAACNRDASTPLGLFLASAEASAMSDEERGLVTGFLEQFPVHLAPGEANIVLDIERKFRPQQEAWSLAVAHGAEQVPARPDANAYLDSIFSLFGWERLTRAMGLEQARFQFGQRMPSNQPTSGHPGGQD